jgi:hypothetical protein
MYPLPTFELRRRDHLRICTNEPNTLPWIYLLATKTAKLSPTNKETNSV